MVLAATEDYSINQKLANFVCEEPDIKYLWLCYSPLLLQEEVIHSNM
jgi:hypothetical protein